MTVDSEEEKERGRRLRESYAKEQMQTAKERKLLEDLHSPYGRFVMGVVVLGIVLLIFWK